jgi:NAD(P)-dependent dehydrogenase (short-subunit alcohol dehydrogenase family)
MSLQDRRKVALITGATRGIGKACALSLARQGFDIVATGRTLKEGEGKVAVPFLKDHGKEVPVPGSLETTIAEVQALGREAQGLPMDVLDRSSMDKVVEQVMSSWGRIDVLVNNALYGGPGMMYPFSEFDIEALEKSALGNLVNQAYLTKLVLPVMIAQGGGVIVGLSSGAALMPSPIPARKGGWGYVYGGPKSGFHRLCEFVHLEHHQDGILAVNVEPGRTVTEASLAMFGKQAEIDRLAPPTQPSVTGDVVAWIATQPEAREWGGKLISSPTFFKNQGITFP